MRISKLSTIILLLLISITVILIITGCSNKKSNQQHELIICGEQEVSILSFENTTDTTYKKVWSWTEKDAKELPDSLKQLLFATDECKSVNKGEQILITASWRGGVALIDRQSKKMLFYAVLPNAHSAELLPNNRVVVAGSKAIGGNCLNVYNINKSNHVIFTDSLYSGHGVIWDKKREILWALGYDDLRAYTLENWNSNTPSLKLIDTYKIPGISGHDLQRVPESANLLITENESVWNFDRDKRTFSEFKTLAEIKHVKSVMINSFTNQLVYVYADSGKAHSKYIRFSNPSKEIYFLEKKIYKARWVINSQ